MAQLSRNRLAITIFKAAMDHKTFINVQDIELGIRYEQDIPSVSKTFTSCETESALTTSTWEQSSAASSSTTVSDIKTAAPLGTGGGEADTYNDSYQLPAKHGSQVKRYLFC